MGIEIKYVIVGKWKENSYLIQKDKEAWLIDPGDNFTLLDHEFDASHKNINGIINTHGHFDHIGAVQGFKTKYNLKFYIHSKDKQLVAQANLYRSLAGDKTVFSTPNVDLFLDSIPYLFLGDKKILIHYLPGHTHGSVCFEIDNCLFSGDILFKNNIGRTDLPGGNKLLLRNSVNYILHHFAGYTIYPGHGEPFSLEESVIEKLKMLL